MTTLEERATALADMMISDQKRMEAAISSITDGLSAAETEAVVLRAEAMIAEADALMMRVELRR